MEGDSKQGALLRGVGSGYRIPPRGADGAALKGWRELGGEGVGKPEIT